MEHAAVSGAKMRFSDLHLSRLFKNYYFMIFLVVHVLVYICVQGTFTFIPYLLIDITGNANALGTIFGTKALFEVPMLLFAGRLTKRFGFVKMIVVGCILFFLEQLCYIFCHNVPSVVLVMVLNGFGFGTYLSCYVGYVHKLAPEDLGATAQTLIGSLGAVSGVICNVVGGIFVQTFGIRHFYMGTVCLQVAAISLFLLSFPIGKKLLHKELPAAVTER